ncbi:MAG: FlgD immunoglobulin-like domain containing protein [Spirochaetota bacterium]
MRPAAVVRRVASRGRSALAVLLLAFIAVGGLASGRAERAPQITIGSAGAQAISPNGDGVQDTLAVEVFPTGDADRAIAAVELAVYGGAGPLAGELVARERVETESPSGVLARLPFIRCASDRSPPGVEWDGTFSGSSSGADGARVPDGEYVYQLVAYDRRRASAPTAPLTVHVDTEPPRIDTVSAEHSVFSPNGDGERDSVRIELGGSSEAAWTARVLRADGETVREYTFADAAPQPVSWDGRDADGEPLPDGVYRWILTGRDAAGNRAVSEPLDVTIDRRVDEIRLVPATQVVSPNGDGIRDRAPIAVELGDREGVVAWRLLVVGEDALPSGADRVPADGERTWLAHDAAAERSGTGAVPRTLVFDARGPDGDPLPDASYRLLLEATYRNGSVVRSEPVRVDVDTRAPTGVLSAQTLPDPTVRGEPVVFGRGSRARLRVSADLEPGEWTALLTYDGAAARIPLDAIGLDGEEASFVWDGNRLPGGESAHDGAYELVLVATDEAGNVGSTNTLRVVRDSRIGRAGLVAERRAFSPNGDGIRDRVAFTVDIGPADGAERVELSIVEASGEIVRTVSSPEEVDSITWHGRSDRGEVAADGTYRARLEVSWRNGARAVATSAPVVLDTTPPRIDELSSPYRLFSPNGDGERDSVRIDQRTSPERLWVGRMVGRDGAVVFERRWKGQANGFVWDGRDSTGKPVADGDYTYELEATDRAGNVARADLALVVDSTSLPVSRQPPLLSLSAGPDPFTPDADGTDDVLSFAIGVTSPNELDSWSLTVTDAEGSELTTLAGDGRPPARLEWDGRSRSGELVHSGQNCFATLRVVDAHGNAATEHARIRVGILATAAGPVLRIRVPCIGFARSETDLFAVPEPELGRNLEALRVVARVLRRYPEREILIEGHAAHDERIDDPERDDGQRDELAALSAARAEEVFRALVILGVEEERMTTVGVGDDRPVVPPSDGEGNWKNRRVEFILKQD